MNIIIASVTVMTLVLMISGIVLKNGLLLLASTVSWIIFAFLMFNYTFDNAAINTALLMFGGFMSILCAVFALNQMMSGRRGIPPEDDYESYKRKVLDATRRR